MHFRIILLTLVITSVALLGLQNVVTRTVSLIDEPVTIFDDSFYNDGNSTSSIESSTPAVIAQCNLNKQYAWPYCELQFDVRDSYWMGQDLSGMEKVRLEMSATYNQQPITDQALRLHVKNYDGDLPENARIKTNHIEFFLTNDLNSIDLPFAYLQVADWWKQDNQIPLEKSFADVSEVQYISIATPSNALAGEYRLTINKLDVVGPWIASQHLYLLLLCSWIFAAVVYLVYSFATTKQKVSQLTEQNSELKQSHRHIEHLASIDTLTGALNRRGANRVIDKLGQSQFGILYIDLDHFKRLNDDYGHEAGDRTLRQFSEMMMSLTDNNSHFVRWGGEEFLILIEFATQASCIKLAQSIQTALLDSTQFDGKVITCSIGVAINIQNQPFEQVLSKADNALYIAKNRGRNCIQAA